MYDGLWFGENNDSLCYCHSTVAIDTSLFKYYLKTKVLKVVPFNKEFTKLFKISICGVDKIIGSNTKFVLFNVVYLA